MIEDKVKKALMFCGTGLLALSLGYASAKEVPKKLIKPRSELLISYHRPDDYKLNSEDIANYVGTCNPIKKNNCGFGVRYVHVKK